MSIHLEPFDGNDGIWDRFINEDSINGTFLQSRRFLNYHPQGRFEDASYYIKDDNKLIGVIPACVRNNDGIRELFSHSGSSYGGPVIRRDHYTAERLMEIVEAMDKSFADNYDRVTFKITPDLFSEESSDLLEYVFGRYGFGKYIELSTYVDLVQCPDDCMSMLDRNKKRNIRKCEDLGLSFRTLESDEDIAGFYELLKINLSKYDRKPIHSLDEILDFKKNRLTDIVRFYGVFNGEEQVAGGMLFSFDRTKVLHAQNLSADYRLTDYSPITYLYYNVIVEAKKLGYKALSWGISTEDHGEYLNMGLIRNKESYGSKHQLNRTFYKDYK